MRRLLAFFLFVCGWLALTQMAAAAVRVNVDLSSQTMHVEAAGGESYDWAISSARSGFSTPRGYYKPQRLERMHYSRKYHNSPMPYSIFFRGGYAIHGTGSVRDLGRPASHGCIRLAPGNAAALYALVKQEGARIQISGTPPKSQPFADARPKRRHVAAHHRQQHPRYTVARVRERAIPLAYAPAAAPQPRYYQRPIPRGPFGWFAR